MPSKSAGKDQFRENNLLTFKKGDKNAYSKSTDACHFTKFKKNKDDFHWIYSDEPHSTRRKEILAAHPEIKKLLGPEIKTAYIVLALVVFQFGMAGYATTCSWPMFMFIVYVFSATINHSLQLANHEISHNLAFSKTEYNYILGIIANFPTGFPSSILFRLYHMDHHQYQGVDGTDTDIPSDWELRTFRSRPMKFLWMLSQSLAYTLRPLYVKPKPINRWQLLNAGCVFLYDYFVYRTFGIWALMYMMTGALVGLGLHPCAGHFICEHYEFVKGFETYSYYGSCNFFNFNVGCHNEHHDFPKIPWSRLHQVRKIAPEWYDHLPHHNSYIRAIWMYIMDDELGPWSRVKRTNCSQLMADTKKKK